MGRPCAEERGLAWCSSSQALEIDLFTKEELDGLADSGRLESLDGFGWEVLGERGTHRYVIMGPCRLVRFASGVVGRREQE